MNGEKYDITMLQTAQLWAKHSRAKLQVGAVIAKDNRIISHGYNGTPAGYHNACENHLGQTLPEVLHAECNAILFAARAGISLFGATAYITHEPCAQCAAMLAQVGITRIVFCKGHTSRTKGNGGAICFGLDVEYTQFYLD